MVSWAIPSMPCHDSSALPLLTGTSPLSCMVPAARSLPKRCGVGVFFQDPGEVKEQILSRTDAGVRQLSILTAVCWQCHGSLRNPIWVWGPGTTHLQGVTATTSGLRPVPREELVGAGAGRPPQPLVDAAGQVVGARSQATALQVWEERQQGLCSTGGRGHPTSMSPGQGAGLTTAAGRARCGIPLSMSPRVLAERLSFSSRRV